MFFLTPHLRLQVCSSCPSWMLTLTSLFNIFSDIRKGPLTVAAYQLQEETRKLTCIAIVFITTNSSKIHSFIYTLVHLHLLCFVVCAGRQETETCTTTTRKNKIFLARPLLELQHWGSTWLSTVLIIIWRYKMSMTLLLQVVLSSCSASLFLFHERHWLDVVL